ncbi:hypothetical protein [Plantactinospora sp. GCM10030261]|uniref:hypothetical protein n=1 Tax=Plantactinospora sp. GCM10030261 TaxID=3273420 RepID=UPI00360FBFC7
MKTARNTVVALALAVSLGAGMTACGGSTENNAGPATAGSASSAASPSASADPTEELRAAARKLGEQSSRATMESSVLNSITVLDPVKRVGHAKMTLSAGSTKMKMEVILLDTDVYLKIDGAGMPKKWMHADAGQIKAGGSLDIVPKDDPARVDGLINAVMDTERAADGTFTGTLDLSKAPTMTAGDLKAMGATTVPFTAKVDDQGRLVEMSMDMSKIQDGLGKMTTTYADFGAPVTVAKPSASQVTEMPADLLESMNKTA